MSRKRKVTSITIYVGYSSEPYQGCSPPEICTADKEYANRWVAQLESRELEEFEVELITNEPQSKREKG